MDILPTRLEQFPSATLDSETPLEKPQVSIVVPIYNEVESLPKLIDAIQTSLQTTDVTYELICVDDGSRDGSTELLKELAANNPILKAVILRRNYGQTAAMSAGFNNSRGEVIVTLDGDLQNDPADIPILLDKLAEGYDVVSGWRKNRQDAALTRLLPSKIANGLIGRMTDVKLHDYGCSLKAYRAEVAADLKLYGELHRFLPALAAIEGARITEIPVRHHARQFGHSKYGLDRTFRVVMDLLTISFIKKFLTRPMHVFGLLGLFSLLIGVLSGVYLTFLKYGLGQSIGDRPLLILAVLLTLTGVQLFSFGLLAEVLMRTYHESQNRPIYRVREVVSGHNSKSQHLAKRS
ncbi:glycosyltransferase family 2 protein [Capilliphycus salinus ALCB114379]|uniref:glycosyltransferase family 2 protein n=1 Tax=Capilliphycus salinus TaxID=2768948 RepID=UPI0039A4BE90